MAAGLRAFISYVREDSRAVDRIQQALEAAGIPVWRDVDALWPGENWRRRIRQAIEQDSLAFIACFSAASEGRRLSYQREELLLAIEQLRRLPPDQPWFIPVRLDDCEIPDYDVGPGSTLGDYNRVDLFGRGRSRAMTRLVDAVRQLLPEPPTPTRGELTRWTDRDWERIVEQLKYGDCTPFLGPGVSTPPLPTDTELARHWANQYRVPSTTLPEVMQAAYSTEGDAVTVKTRFARHLSGFADPDFADPVEPHRLFAELPIPTYLTTSYDDFMAWALRRQGKKPLTTICAWHDGAADDPSIATPDGYHPSVENPLVYHFHGIWQYPAWLVLSEQDDQDFEKALTDGGGINRPEVVPVVVRTALAEQALLFIGHDLTDQRYRSLFRSLVAGLRGLRRRHAMVQTPSLKAERFLESNLPQNGISIYWGTVSEFCSELRSRLPDHTL